MGKGVRGGFVVAARGAFRNIVVGIKRLDPRAKAIECLLKVKALQINERHAHVSLVRPMLERKRELLKLFEQFGVRHKWLKCLSSMLIIFDLRREKATGYDLSLCRFMLQCAVGRNEPQEMSQLTVLVVDDSEDTCRMLAKLIRRLGAPADCITSGEAALKWMTDHTPRLVILDIMMPGMDGMAVLHAIRADDRLKEVAVVMFSAVSDPAFRDYAISEGANDYWVKSSIDFSKLPQYLKPYLEPGTMHG